MPKYAANVAFTAPSAGAPFCSIHTGSSYQARITQIAVFSAAATALSPAVYRASNTPVASTSVLGQQLDPHDPASTVSLDTAWSTAPLISTNVALKGAVLPSVVGAGMIWQWTGELLVPANGWLVLWHFGAATGPAGRAEFEWSE